MAHQTHALPWNTLASQVKHTVSYHSEPQRKDIFSVGKPNSTKEVDYFCRALAKRIREFSETERAKFAPKEEYQKRARGWKSGPNAKKVYPDKQDLDCQAPEDADFWFHKRLWGNPGLQQVEKWLNPQYGSRIAHADTLKLMMIEAVGMKPAFSSRIDADAAEKIQKDMMDSMLLLANHPDADLPSLVNMHHGHHFGLSRVAEEGIRGYVYLNLILAMQENGSDICDYVVDENGVENKSRRKYMDTTSYKKMLDSVAGSYDGDAQNLVHWDFFYERTEDDWNRDTSKDVLADLDALKEYLKGVWKVLVVYDLVLREAGGDPDIEGECRKMLNWSFLL
ncbi:hypothetical protein PpBr36_05267 [Pyricularia pennisetigena]|uniref:hypothetical protein n=1 Tax=Pyricularia pennisetigena TaxID=1578925 RepID=UPI00114DBE04|nr:hypothetical protein PpBr36_05267 [Pyricularia pennisetigena]TLS27012.1 hypothetical protein PpBr36_05267 [Pyricularia pennisetigena]